MLYSLLFGLLSLSSWLSWGYWFDFLLRQASCGHKLQPYRSADGILGQVVVLCRWPVFRCLATWVWPWVDMYPPGVVFLSHGVFDLKVLPVGLCLVESLAFSSPCVCKWYSLSFWVELGIHVAASVAWFPNTLLLTGLKMLVLFCCSGRLAADINWQTKLGWILFGGGCFGSWLCLSWVCLDIWLWLWIDVCWVEAVPPCMVFGFEPRFSVISRPFGFYLVNHW